MSQDFFKFIWDLIKHEMFTIVNQMYAEGKMTNKQKHGMIVCIQKKPHPLRSEDYRPLTLLNADYKLLTRVIANRLNSWLDTFLNPSQHCALRGHTFLRP
jgi:hypothetical protein